MRLADIKGVYDAVFSLGSNCYPAQRMERYGMRPYSGVLDWMYSNSIPGLCALLRSRFTHFMHPANIIVDGEVFNGHNYSVYDSAYSVQSVHDFLCAEGREGITEKYPQFQEKLQRRIDRFLGKMEQCRHIFFFRLHATYDEAEQLEQSLSSIVKHQYTLLVVNPGSVYHVVDYNWPLSHTCGLEIPAEWDARSDELWAGVFTGISYCELNSSNE